MKGVHGLCQELFVGKKEAAEEDPLGEGGMGGVPGHSSTAIEKKRDNMRITERSDEK
jgi:hypothetical protein